LNQLKIFVLPSYTEGVPGIVLEAMACGAFPIVTNIAANQELIIHGENGFLFSPKLFREAAESIIDSLQNPALLNQSTIINIEKIRQSGDIRRNLRRLHEAYNKLVESYQNN